METLENTLVCYNTLQNKNFKMNWEKDLLLINKQNCIIIFSCTTAQVLTFTSITYEGNVSNKKFFSKEIKKSKQNCILLINPKNATIISLGSIEYERHFMYRYQ